MSLTELKQQAASLPPKQRRELSGYLVAHCYETIIQRQIRAGRASNKSEIM